MKKESGLSSVQGCQKNLLHSMQNVILCVEKAEGDGHPRFLSIKVQTWILDRSNTNCTYM